MEDDFIIYDFGEFVNVFGKIGQYNQRNGQRLFSGSAANKDSPFRPQPTGQHKVTCRFLGGGFRSLTQPPANSFGKAARQVIQ